MSGVHSICFAASEIAPFAKTGGLADVSAALPLELHRQGHDVRLFMPCYSELKTDGEQLEPVPGIVNIPVKIGWHEYHFTLRRCRYPGSDLDVHFVDCPELFHRRSIYTQDDDEHRRFALFSHAVLISCQRLGFKPDIIHSNDWHTGLIPLLARTAYEWDALFSRSRHLLTIHNIGYQGLFPESTIDDLGLSPWRYLLDQEDLTAERFSFLRTGLIYAHAISTVSPTYAREIQTTEFGMGLEGLLRSRQDRLIGILNGVDYRVWSPEKDALIPYRYSAKRPAGKRKNKRFLLNKVGLPESVQPPLFGIVSRLTGQKGFELCMQVLPELLAARNVRLVVLGSGESKYEQFFSELQQRFPRRCLFYRGYNEELSHWIEAASDFFIMPSRYEPCGLNQMFSLRYGTIPIVRRTGGLADSVEQIDGDRGNGIIFDHFSARGLVWAIDRALQLYADPKAMLAARQRAMLTDHSWATRTKSYAKLYARLIAERPASR